MFWDRFPSEKGGWKSLAGHGRRCQHLILPPVTDDGEGRVLDKWQLSWDELLDT